MNNLNTLLVSNADAIDMAWNNVNIKGWEWQMSMNSNNISFSFPNPITWTVWYVHDLSWYYTDRSFADVWYVNASINSSLLKSWNLVTINWSNEIDLWWTATTDAVLDMDENSFKINNLDSHLYVEDISAEVGTNNAYTEWMWDNVLITAWDWWSAETRFEVSPNNITVYWDTTNHSWIQYSYTNWFDYWYWSIPHLWYITWLIANNTLTGWSAIIVDWNNHINLWWLASGDVEIDMDWGAFLIENALSSTFAASNGTVLDLYDDAFDFYTAGWSWFEWRPNWILYRHDYTSNNPLRVPHKKYVDDAIAAASSVNIYSSDGTMSSNRTVAWNLKDIAFNNFFNYWIYGLDVKLWASSANPNVRITADDLEYRWDDMRANFASDISFQATGDITLDAYADTLIWKNSDKIILWDEISPTFDEKFIALRPATNVFEVVLSWYWSWNICSSYHQR